MLGDSNREDSTMAESRDEQRAREAREALARVARDTETLGTSSAARAASAGAKRMADHFAARDAQGADGAADPVEVWGRRIGRGLSLIGVIVLAWLLGGQLGFW